MKSNYILIPLLLLTVNIASSQDIKETVQVLTAKSQKGYMYDVAKDGNGDNTITFKMKVDKKGENVSYEKYSFDKDLKFIATADVQEKKEQKEDYESTSFYAYVGGANSFNVLSMKLKINKWVAVKTWNHEKQLYVIKKNISDEVIKPKNDAGKVYLGYASYTSSDPAKTDVFVLAKTEEKKQSDKFLLLMFNDKLDLSEKPLDLNGDYSMVFCQQIAASDDVVMVFAPTSSGSDISKYVYFQYDVAGNLKNRVEFKSPASALLITAAEEKDGNVYFVGSSKKSDKSYEKEFHEFAPIYNPGATPEGKNYADIKWKKDANEKMENFHLLKFSGNQLVFASTTAVSDFKSKFKTAPGDKGATAYKGQRLTIEKFYVTPSQDYLVAGQLTGSVKFDSDFNQDSYEDIICLQFDKTGNLKAQYGVGKMNNDKKSEIFPMRQQFYPSADGKSVYWELMEVKGIKGYESFGDALFGYSSFYPVFFPRIAAIDLAASNMGAVKVLGDEKFFIRRNFPSTFDQNENSLTYFGHDMDWKKLWLGKVMLK